MRMHGSLIKVIAAARREAKRTTDRKMKKQLKEAIANVVLFRDDNHDFIEFYNDDAGLE